MTSPIEIVDPHIHLFDVHSTPREQTPLVKLFGWNDRVLQTVAKRAFPKETIDFFGEENHILADYLTAELRNDSKASGVGQYVHVQAGWKNKSPLDAVGETEWLDGLDDPPSGIVGYADLTLGAAVAPVLKGHLAASDRMRGIRHMLAHHPAAGVMDFSDDPSLSGRLTFRAGIEQLAAHGLTFDAWAYSHQLGGVADLARTNPDLPIVLCHAGTPVGYGGEFAGVGATDHERKEIAARWADGIAAVAAQPNVVVKLSGLLMPVLGFDLEHSGQSASVERVMDCIGPLVRACIEAFGADRCMFASNFPVDKVSTDYLTLIEALTELTNQDGRQAQEHIFGGTAKRFYRL